MSVTATTTRSVPATRDVPDAGRRTAVIDVDAGVNAVPSDNRKVETLRVAENVAEEKTVVAGNSKELMAPTGPGAIVPRLTVCVEPPVTSFKVLPKKLRAVNAGKSGGSAKPPVAGSPVRLEISNTATPGEPGPPGVKTSKEITPRLAVAA
jgi:hypothetical protein